MKSIHLVSLILSALFFQQCSSAPKSSSPSQSDAQPSAAPVKISKELYAKLNLAVFEVVTPKRTDTFVKYEKPLPYDKLPYKERTDKYIRIGTAFSVASGKYVSAAHLFNLHVLSFADEYFVRDLKGNVYKIKSFSKYSQHRDLVEFSLEKEPTGVVPLPVKMNPEIGDEVLTVGNALGEGITVRGGQIASFTPEEDDGLWQDIRYTAPASPGNSGGPLISSSGEVLGVVVKRTENENLNFAVPMSEFEKLSRSKSEFYIKSLPVSDQNKSENYSWKFNTSLPATVAELSKKAEGNFRQEYLANYRKLQKTHSKEMFPKHEKFAEYAVSQRYPFGFASLSVDPSGNWKLSSQKFQELKIGSEQSLFVALPSEEGSNLLSQFDVLIDKPKGMPLSKFVGDSKLVMDTILEKLGWNITFAGEKVKIHSYGKPHREELWKDAIGRPWMTWTWNLRERDRIFRADCMPVPDGMACQVMESSTLLDSFAMDEIARNEMHRVMMSYSGRIENWKQFLALDKKLLPAEFHHAKLSFGKKGPMKLEFGHYSLNLADSMNIEGTSDLSVLIGYNPDQPMSQEVQGFSIIPRMDKAQSLSVFAFYQPVEAMATEYHQNWNDVISKKAPYNGIVHTKENTHKILSVQQTPDRKIAGKKKSVHSKAELISCRKGTEESSESLEAECQKFKSGLQIR